jgi:hypothetical protein
MPFPPRSRSWPRALAAAAVAAALLAGCGGGTSQFEPFKPQRMFAFGDEASALSAGGAAPRGSTWSVNGVDRNGAVDCTLRPIWTQQLAAIYGFVFAECPGNATVFAARTYAAAGAKVRNLDAQIETARTDAGGFNERTWPPTSPAPTTSWSCTSSIRHAARRTCWPRHAPAAPQPRARSTG